MDVYVYQGINPSDSFLTTSTEQPGSPVHSACIDVIKLKVSGCVCAHRLIRRRTLTFLRTAASRSISSNGDQYLVRKQNANHTADKTPQYTVFLI